MTIKRRLITGNVRKATCDKCGCKVQHFFTRVCLSCSNEKLEGKRISDFVFQHCVIGSWQDHYDKCRLCGNEFGKKESKEICESCVGSLHPDSSHQGSGTSPGWGCEIPTRNSAYHCRKCGGIQVIEIEEGSLRYFYYKIGGKRRTNQPYVCENKAIANLIARDKCVHEYIMVLNIAMNGDRMDVADKLYKKLRKKNNLGWFIDEEDAQDIYERQAYGETHLWCWKCSAYYIPTGKPSFVPPEIGWGEKYDNDDLDDLS